MISKIAYFMIFGKPLIFYAGVITFIAFLFTAYIGWANAKGFGRIDFKWHTRIAKIAIAVAIVHALLGILLYF